jgi:signal transduction histidine kinase
VIATTATTSLTELKDRLDTLESSGSPLDRSRIAEVGRRLGVDLDVQAPAAALTGPAAALAFRVVREAVVNVARHTHHASASVRVARAGRDLTVEVVDTGGTHAVPVVTGAGRGLRGLTEAVSSVGGSMTWGDHDGGGFRVSARIPEVSS